MARAQVKVQITDDSYVIPFSGGDSQTVGGMVSVAHTQHHHGLLTVLGNTAERTNDYMTIENVGDWMQRLTSLEPTGVAAATGDDASEWPFYHARHDGSFDAGNAYANGNTFERWPGGPTGGWQGDWWFVHNFLQYGGRCIVAGSESTLQDKSLNLDVVFVGASTGGADYANNRYLPNPTQVTTAVNVATARKDCIAVVPNGGTAAVTSVPSRVSGSQASEYVVEVFGQKYQTNINRNANENETGLINIHCAPDVAGIMARTDQIADPWISPAGARRGTLIDAIKLAYNPTTGEQDTLYDGAVNPIINDPDNGIMLFGDKTTTVATSTLSRINVSRLFIHLKKTIGAAARSKLFEINDADTRSSFKNAIEPFLTQIKSRDGIYDFRVVCDETNNTSNIIDSNQFVADVFVQPAKSINFIQIQFTNKNTQDSLG